MGGSVSKFNVELAASILAHLSLSVCKPLIKHERKLVYGTCILFTTLTNGHLPYTVTPLPHVPSPTLEALQSNVLQRTTLLIVHVQCPHLHQQSQHSQLGHSKQR